MEKIDFLSDKEEEIKAKLDEARDEEFIGDRPTTDFEKSMIFMSLVGVAKFLREHNIEYPLEDFISVKNIVIKEQRQKIGNCILAGQYFPKSRKIEIYLANEKDSIIFPTILIHEMLHSVSHQALKLDLDKQGEIVGSSSNGLSMASQDQGIPVQLFARLDEAFTEMLTRLITKDVFGEEYLKGMSRPYDKDVDVLSRHLDFINRSQKILSLEGKDFLSEEQVFQIFLNAYVKGQILPLARLFEKSYGKGWFKEMGWAYSIIG